MHIQDHRKIQDGTLCDRSQRRLAVKLCHKELHPNSSVNPRHPSGVTDDYLAIIELLKSLFKCYLGGWKKFSGQYSATKSTIHQLSENFINVLQIFTVPLTELFCNFLKSLFISILENFISFRLFLVALRIVPSAPATTGNILKR